MSHFDFICSLACVNNTQNSPSRDFVSIKAPGFSGKHSQGFYWAFYRPAPVYLVSHAFAGFCRHLRAFAGFSGL